MNLQSLNQAQLDAVTCPLKPTLVLAGAGSGKTRVLTNRILYLTQECGVSPREILAITFTNKAANEMKQRLWQFDSNAQFMHISTIHSFCASVLRREAEAFNRSKNFTIYTEDDKKSMLKKIVKDLFDDSDAKMVDGFSDSISELKNNAPELMLEQETVQQNNDYVALQLEKLQSTTQCSNTQDLLKVINEYNSKMAQSNAMDFDDLLYYVHKLFANFPEILEKYREIYKYILIDEFQDTNKVQYQIFQMLGSKYGNIFVVGDDDQSIYSWRGADSKNLLKFTKDFQDCQIFKLEQNYRSTKRILDLANKVIVANAGRFDKVLWTQNEDGLKPQLFTAYNEHDEAYYVCEQIKNLCYLNPDYKLKDFAILMRINALSRSFEAELLKNHIPYKVFGGFKFFERKEVKDVLAYLRLIDNPADSEAFFRALNVPRKRGIGDTTMAILRTLSADYGICLVDVISDERNLEIFNSSIRKKLLDFHKLYVELVELCGKLTVGTFVHTALDILEFRQVYKEMDDLDRSMNIDELEQSVVEFQKSFPGATLSDYLQSVSLSSDLDEKTAKDFVTIATIHAVKGLEFKTVFVVGLEEGIFPTSRSTYQLETLQEERRLMYVAITRAEKRLYATRAKTRFLYGQRKNTFPSTYYREMEKILAPERKPISERHLENGAFLDKLNQTNPLQSQPSTAKSRAEVVKFKPGQIVQHATYGQGIILMIKNDVADVIFEKMGKKSLNLKFAPLTIIK